MRRLGDAFRQTGQDAVRSLDQQDADVALWIDTIEPVGNHFARGAMQLGSQLGTGCAGADNGHVELAGAHRAVLRLHAYAGINQTPIEALRLRRGFQRHRMLGDAWCAEIIGHAADRDHQCVVADRPRRGDLHAPRHQRWRRGAPPWRR